MIFKILKPRKSYRLSQDLVEKHGADTTTYFPDELNRIIGKKLLFRVKFFKYNHKNNSHIYRCERVTNDEEIITYWKQGFFKDEESEEDSEDELTTLAVSIKTTKILNMTRKVMRKSPIIKYPFIAVDEEPASQKVIVRVKVEKDIEKDIEKDVEKEVENDEDLK
ncbi:hypothetical protein Tco_0700282 [Tanacetum coccineum]